MEPIGIGDVMGRIASIQARFGSVSVTRAAVSPAPAATSEPAFAKTFERVSSSRDAAGNAATFTAAATATPTTAGPATVSQAWHDRLPAAAKPWAGAIEAAAAEHGLDPKLLASLVWAESGFKPDARSHAGAVGLAQLMPATARGLGVDPHDPLQNLRGGARYLKEQLDRFGSPSLALAAYNAGPNRVAQAGGIPDIRETQTYVTRVLGYADRLR